MMTAKKQTQQKPSAARVDSGISINPSHQRGLQGNLFPWRSHLKQLNLAEISGFHLHSEP